MSYDRSRDSYRNWLSLTGSALATVGAILFLAFFFLDLAGFQGNPYFGIVSYLFLPALFVLGLLLIPFGLWRARRRAAAGRPMHEWPVIDLSQRHVRHAVVGVVALTCVNAAIIATATTESVEYVDSREFCTGVCHTPMEPEGVAHQRSVHASITCATCHVGPGAEGFVRAKLGGVRRLAAVVSGSYLRPIPAPVHDLPAAVGTCRGCHTPTKYVGDVVRRFPYYSDDEAVTEQVTTMTVRVGGGGWEAGGPGGIHWHASPQTRVEYIATGRNRETIPFVRVSDSKGVREYAVEGTTAEELAAGEQRVMDCTDCHNRAGHDIAATPDRAVDRALAQGVLPRTLPFVRREAIAALSAEYSDRVTADQGIAQRITTFYSQQSNLTSDPRVTETIRAAQALHAGNVFPRMNVKWGTYPSNLGHTDVTGCFRCHDDLHKTKAGAAISQDCELCHRME